MRHLVLGLTCGILVAFVAAWEPAGAVQQPHGTITGLVVAGLTDDPVADAGVRLTPRTRGAVALSTRTDASGVFSFAKVAPGTYQLEATKDGYIFGSFGQRRAGGRGHPVVVAAGAALSGLHVPVWRFSSISGRVFSNRGEPMRGVGVQAYRRTVRGGRSWPLPQGKIVETDDRGEYRIPDLIHGSFLVAVIPRRSAALSAYPMLSYPGARVPAAAQWLELAPGEDRRSIDFELAPVPTVRVQGRLVSPSGADVDSIPVRLVIADLGRRTDLEIAAAASTADGHFDFGAVPEGQYFVEAYPASRQPGVTPDFRGPEMPTRPVSPAGGTMGPIDIDADVPTQVQIEVALSSERGFEGTVTPPAGAPPYALERILLVAFTADGRRAVRLVVDESGRFRAAAGVPPGRYLIRLGPGVPPGWFLERITAATLDVTETPVVVSDQDVRDIEVRFSTTGSTISGTVTATANSQPDPDAAVLLFPADERLWFDYGRDSPRIRSARARDGKYRFSGVLPGDYLILAIKDELTDGWQAGERLEALSRLATPIEVDRDDRIVLDLRTPPVETRRLPLTLALRSSPTCPSASPCG